MAEPLLSEAEASEIRATLEANLPHICDIQTDEGSEDAAGGHVQSWTSSEEETPCALSEIAPAQLAPRDEQTQSVATWRVRFAAGTAVADGARLIVTGTNHGLAFSKTLIVLGVVPSQTATLAQCREAVAAELDDAPDES